MNDILKKLDDNKKSHIDIRDSYNNKDAEMHSYHEGIVEGLIKAKEIIEDNKFKVSDFIIWDSDTFPQACFLVDRNEYNDTFISHEGEIVTREQLNYARHATVEEITNLVGDVS